MYKISKHRNYKNIDKIKYHKQCSIMEKYISTPYDVYWIGMNEECYGEYLQKQDKLYEGLIKTYPMDVVIQELHDNYFDAFEKDSANDTKIIVVYGVQVYEDEEENDEILLKSIMNKNGYILKEKIKSFEGDDYHYDYYFTPKFSYESTEEAYSGDMCVYHLTNDYYINKILKNGLVPKTKNKIENHPDRVYVTKKKNMNNKFILQMYKYMKNHTYKKIKKLYILKIDLSKCEDKRFFWDPSAPNGMFTYENIPPQCITIEKEYKI